MKGSETKDSKQCECHVGGGPGGRGEEIVTKCKRRYQSWKEKGEEYQQKETKEKWKRIHSFVMAGIGSKPNHA